MSETNKIKQEIIQIPEQIKDRGIPVNRATIFAG
jgi:hypothetical protein